MASLPFAYSIVECTLAVTIAPCCPKPTVTRTVALCPPIRLGVADELTCTTRVFESPCCASRRVSALSWGGAVSEGMADRPEYLAAIEGDGPVAHIRPVPATSVDFQRWLDPYSCSGAIREFLFQTGIDTAIRVRSAAILHASRNHVLKESRAEVLGSSNSCELLVRTLLRDLWHRHLRAEAVVIV